MTQSQIQIKRMIDYKYPINQEMSKIFVEAYYDELKSLSKSKEKLEQAFISAFQRDFFYIAELNGEIVGILACTTNQKRAIVVNKSSFQKSFGFMKGLLYYFFLKSIFNKELSYSPEVGYIECVATAKAARGKGVATALLNHVLINLPINHYLLEMVDTNEIAMKVYKKAGFQETNRQKIKSGRKKAYHEKITMEFLK